MFNINYYTLFCKACGVAIRQTNNKADICKEHICPACNQTNTKPSWQIYQDAYQERMNNA